MVRFPLNNVSGWILITRDEQSQLSTTHPHRHLSFCLFKRAFRFKHRDALDGFLSLICILGGIGLEYGTGGSDNLYIEVFAVPRQVGFVAFHLYLRLRAGYPRHDGVRIEQFHFVCHLHRAVIQQRELAIGALRFLLIDFTQVQLGGRLLCLGMFLADKGVSGGILQAVVYVDDIVREVVGGPDDERADFMGQ